MENTIPTRIFDFLRNFPPFSLMSKEDLMGLSEQVNIRYLQPNEVVFKQGEEPVPFVYVVHEGAIHLYKEGEMEKVLVEECDEGDLFGLRPLLAEESYLLTAMAEEETLLYAINIDQLKKIGENHSKIAWYLAQNFAAGRRSGDDQNHSAPQFHDQYQTNDAFKLIEIQSIDRSKTPVTCTSTTSIQDAAKIMREKRVGSIIVVDDRHFPIGIITDRDFRNNVVTGDFSLKDNVDDIMSKPVITIPMDKTVADVQIAMMKYGVHHLCLTENGRTDSKVVGVISEHDLLVIQGNNPAIFIREITRATSAEDLKRIREKAEDLLFKYLIQEVSISFISKMITEVNDALICKAIDMAEIEMVAEDREKPLIKYCWLALGSEGREEQLLRTDQDNALIFEDVPEDDYDGVKSYFLDLSKKVTDILNHCGFDYCPGEMMASNPKWCLSMSEWKEQFRKWIVTPTEKNVMYCTIFFDFRPITGDFSMSEELANHIFELLDTKSQFFQFLTKNALQKPPPLTFFRNFVVEKSGEHKNEFDIKGRAMMPLTDAARILTLQARMPNINNTFHRFDQLALLEPNNKELFEQAADAYEVLVRYRAMQGLKNGDSGRYINPSELTKMERLNLRNSFRPISELQDLLKVRFRMNLFM